MLLKIFMINGCCIDWLGWLAGWCVGLWKYRLLDPYVSYIKLIYKKKKQYLYSIKSSKLLVYISESPTERVFYGLHYPTVINWGCCDIFNLFVSIHMCFLSISHSANILFNPVKTWNRLHRVKHLLVLWYVQNWWVPCFVLVSSHSLMTGGPGSGQTATWHTMYELNVCQT